jgi:hypothetical protein
MEYFRGKKPLGTIIQRRDGNTFVKTERGWISEARLVASLQIEKRELEKNEKVYHRDCTGIGKRDYNEKENLVVLKFRTTKYRLLPHPEIVYLPVAKAQRARQVS